MSLPETEGEAFQRVRDARLRREAGVGLPLDRAMAHSGYDAPVCQFCAAACGEHRATCPTRLENAARVSNLAPNPHCGIPGCTRGMYHDHRLPVPIAERMTTGARWDEDVCARVMRWAMSQGCPEGTLIADWLERQKIATPQLIEAVSLDIEQHVADRRLLAKALPALADLASAHPEIATLCGEIKETLHPKSIASGVIVAVDLEKKRITIEDRP